MKVVRLNTQYRKRNRTQCFIAFVDDEDYELVSEYHWTISRKKYSTCAFNNEVGLMHRFVIDPPRGTHIHHIDGNGLNNTQENLHIVSPRHHAYIHRPWMKNKSFSRSKIGLDRQKQGA